MVGINPREMRMNDEQEIYPIVTTIPGTWKMAIRAWWYRNTHIRYGKFCAWLDGNRRYPW
jgi:hypothetical protein